MDELKIRGSHVMSKITHYLKIELPDNITDTTVERLRQDVENYMESTMAYYLGREYKPLKVKIVSVGSNSS